VAILVLLYLVIIFLPTLIADTGAFGEVGEAFTTQNEIRRTLLQVCGGAALLIGGYLVWRQLLVSREVLSRRAQIDQRLTWALDQLGKSHSDIEALASIYALEDLARHSPDNQSLIGRVLCAYIRTQSPWPPYRPGQYLPDAPLEEIPTLRVRAPVVQAAVDALVRGELSSDNFKPLQLDAVDLRLADLSHVRVPQISLAGTSLQGAILAFGDLRDAWLVEADLKAARLVQANLAGAVLRNACLENAMLTGVELMGADLRGSQFVGADLRDANLEGARLISANFTNAQLYGATFKNAVADKDTVWPKGFDPGEAGLA
jgi:hypothetical protein